MSDRKIQSLLQKYLEGKATPDEMKMVDDWYESLSDGHEEMSLSDAERYRLKADYWESLKQKMNPPVVKKADSWRTALAIAASVSAIVAVAYLFLPGTPSEQSLTQVRNVPNMEEIVNYRDVVVNVTLPDSSEVVLSPGSRLRYPSEFDADERKVFLTGEASFDVARNEKKPFYVFANEVITKVLGTRFTVRAYPEDINITVFVESGKVAVRTPSEKRSSVSDGDIVLTPNQQVVYSRTNQKMSRTLVQAPQVVIPEEEARKTRFDGEPVSEIFAILERMYGVDIVFDEGLFSECFITTSLTGKDLYDRIDVICDITGATYSLEGTRIIIRGTGCH